MKLCFYNGIISTKTFCVAFSEEKLFPAIMGNQTINQVFSLMLLEIGRNEEIYGHVRDSKNAIKEQVENLDISNCY